MERTLCGQITKMTSKEVTREKAGPEDLWAKVYLGVGLLGLVVLVIYVLIHRRGPLYDEPLHLDTRRLNQGSV